MGWDKNLLLVVSLLNLTFHAQRLYIARIFQLYMKYGRRRLGMLNTHWREAPLPILLHEDDHRIQPHASDGRKDKRNPLCRKI